MKNRLFILAILTICNSISYSQSLTSGNLVVLRIGDSTATLASTGNTLAVDQFTTSGSYVNSIILPKTGVNAICLGGTATSEGQLSLATNSSAISFLAYKTAAPYASAVGSTTSAAVNRTVVTVNASGTVSFPTLTTASFSAVSPRSVVTNGTSFWGNGGNTGIVWGNGSSNADTIVSSSSTNTRVVNIFGGQLYYSTASGTTGIWKVGTGTPTSSGITSSVYIPLASGTSPSPYGFALNNDSNICYVVDDRAAASGGGIQKWIRSAGAWTLVYTLGTGTGSTVGARAIAVNWNTTPATIFAITSETALNRLIRLNDTSSSVTAITLATAASNTIFRGVAFAPGTSTLPVKIGSFEGKRNNGIIQLDWNSLMEINSSYFEIERSTDGNNFEVIGKVRSKGNSNSLVTYSFSDYSSLSSLLCYRLKMFDMDGVSEFSKSICIQPEMKNSTIKTAYPNSFMNALNIVLIASDDMKAHIVLIDINSKIFYESDVNLVKGENALSINTIDVPSGMYVLQTNTNGVISTVKVIKN